MFISGKQKAASDVKEQDIGQGAIVMKGKMARLNGCAIFFYEKQPLQEISCILRKKDGLYS